MIQPRCSRPRALEMMCRQDRPVVCPDQLPWCCSVRPLPVWMSRDADGGAFRSFLHVNNAPIKPRCGESTNGSTLGLANFIEGTYAVADNRPRPKSLPDWDDLSRPNAGT